METRATGWSVGTPLETTQAAIAQVEAGFPIAALEAFRQRLKLSMNEMAALLRISPRTLARRTKAGHLDPSTSDLLYRLMSLFEHGVAVFEDEQDTRTWMKQPQRGLGGATPLAYARTEPGAQAVERLLNQIDYGVLP